MKTKEAANKEGAGADQVDHGMVHFQVALGISVEAGTVAWFQVLSSYDDISAKAIVVTQVVLFFLIAFIGEWWVGALLSSSSEDMGKSKRARTLAFQNPSRALKFSTLTAVLGILLFSGPLWSLGYAAFIAASWAAYPLTKHVTAGKNLLVAACAVAVKNVFPCWATGHWPPCMLLLCLVTFGRHFFLEVWFDTSDHNSDKTAGVKTVSTLFGRRAARRLAAVGIVATGCLSIIASESKLIGVWDAFAMLSVLLTSDDKKVKTLINRETSFLRDMAKSTNNARDAVIASFDANLMQAQLTFKSVFSRMDPKVAYALPWLSLIF